MIKRMFVKRDIGDGCRCGSAHQADSTAAFKDGQRPCERPYRSSSTNITNNSSRKELETFYIMPKTLASSLKTHTRKEREFETIRMVEQEGPMAHPLLCSSSLCGTRRVDKVADQLARLGCNKSAPCPLAPMYYYCNYYVCFEHIG